MKPNSQAVGEQILVSVMAAAALLGIGLTRMYELIGSGEIEAVKCGRRTLIRVASLHAYVNSLPNFEPKGR